MASHVSLTISQAQSRIARIALVRSQSRGQFNSFGRHTVREIPESDSLHVDCQVFGGGEQIFSIKGTARMVETAVSSTYKSFDFWPGNDSELKMIFLSFHKRTDGFTQMQLFFSTIDYSSSGNTVTICL
jgi:hypothetical protein